MSARLLVLLAPLAGLLLLPAAAPTRPPADRPKLVVVVFFDQMRGDYLTRWADLYPPGGFERLKAAGAWFPDCHYPYASTTTGPGHASVLAGCGGDVHGIINNNWYDRAAGEEVYCAASGDRYTFVPPPAVPKPVTTAKGDARIPKPKPAGDPGRMLADTVADRLKDAGARVFGLSLKDRSAVFPAGHKPDGAYWFTGNFVTSTYYRDALPPWVAEFNASKFADQWAGKTWERSRPDLDYTARSGPDDGPNEGTGKKQGKTFPHPFPAAVGQDYYEAVANSPAGNDLLLELAKRCVVAEKLGTRDTPDLLTVSFSSNDLVGHTWGPDSHEVLDITLRSDRLMADLLAFLDTTVGEGKYAVVLSADHGICPIPPPDKRISPKPLVLAAERFLQAEFGKPTADGGLWLEKLSPPHAYLNHRLLQAKGIDPATAAAKLAKWVEGQPGFVKAYTRADLLGSPPAGDSLWAQVRASYHPDRGGDVVAVTRPFFLLDDYATGTSHGTPHPYDTHVPLTVFGPGVVAGAKSGRVTPLHAATITAKLLGVPPPAKAKYPVPAGLFAD